MDFKWETNTTPLKNTETVPKSVSYSFTICLAWSEKTFWKLTMLSRCREESSGHQQGNADEKPQETAKNTWSQTLPRCVTPVSLEARRDGFTWLCTTYRTSALKTWRTYNLKDLWCIQLIQKLFDAMWLKEKPAMLNPVLSSIAEIIWSLKVKYTILTPIKLGGRICIGLY